MKTIIVLHLRLIMFVNACAWNYVEIVLSLQEHYHSNSINFVHKQPEDLYLIQEAVELQRKAAERYIQLAVSKGRQSYYHYYHPLQVIPYTRNTYLLHSILSQEKLSESIWLVFLENNTKVKEFFSGIDIPFDCQFLVIQPEDDHFVLTEIYRVDSEQPLQTYCYGTWSPTTGLVWSNVGFYQRRNNLQGVLLRTAVRMDFPKLNLPSPPENNDFFTAVCLSLQRRMNFTIPYTIITSSFHEWGGMPEMFSFNTNRVEFVKPNIRGHGIKMDDESWNGILGIMQKGDAALACVDLSFEPSRIQVVDFISVLQDDRHIMFVKKPEVVQLHWRNFLFPFRYDVWIMIFVLGFLVSIILWSSGKSRPCKYFTFSDSILHTFGRICQQGQTMPKSTSGRLLTVVTCLTAVVLLAGYSAFLISYLTQRTPVLPFTSFEGFVCDGRYQLGLDPASSLMDFFQTCSDPTIKQIYKNYLEPNKKYLPSTNSEGLQQVCKRNNYAYVYSLMNFDKYSNEITCQLTAVPQAFVPRLKGIALVKESPYLGIFRHNIHAMARAGVLRRLANQRSGYSQDIQSSCIPIDMPAVLPLFVTLLFGIFLAVLIMIAEIRFKQKGKNIM